MVETTKFIDIESVINKKNPKLYKALPGFVLSYIKRVLHQNDVNHFMAMYSDKFGLDFVNAALDHFDIHGQLVGRENFSEQGRYIFASNHPIGGFDGLLLISELGKIFGETKSIINDVLMQIKNLQPVFVGVDSYGSNTRGIFAEMDKVMKSDTQVLIFPAGLVSRRRKGVIADLEWKKTFITKAVQHQRDVVPMHIEGRLSNFFYNLSNIRKFLGIKANIEMFYLADETFRLNHKTLKITCGKPISYTTFDHRYHPNEWASLVRGYVYELSKQTKDTFEDYITKQRPKL
jgi:1-acyl-sn-glycerol-3-phosphate acyltransferase